MHRIDGLLPRPSYEEIIAAEGLTFDAGSRPDGSPVHYWEERAAYVITPAEVEQIEEVTERLHALCLEAAEHLASGALGTLGLPPRAFRLAADSLAVGAPDVYGRFDLVRSGEGRLVLLEYNADTPTGLVEAAVCQWSRMEALHPGLGESHPRYDQLNGIWPMLVERWRELRPTDGPACMHAAYAREETSGEDAATAAVMAAAAAEAGWEATVLPLEDVRFNLRAGRWVHAVGEGGATRVVNRIDTLFALHPWEAMVEDPALGGLVLSRPDTMRLWVEPPWKMLLSTKVLLVALWSLHPGHENLLPAHIGGPGALTDWVRKPIFGREGSGVQIHAPTFGVHEQAPDEWPSPFSVYQQYVPIPAHTDSRGRAHHPVIGSWVVGGQAAGIGIRESDGPITDATCRFVPHLIDRQAEPQA